jgi:hypothetical protein
MKNSIILFNILKRSLIAVLLIFTCFTSFGQIEEKKTHKPDYPLVITGFNHSLSLPFNKILREPVHPGLTVGTELFYTNGKHSQLLQTVQLGGFYNRYFGTSAFLSSDFAYRYITRRGLYGQAMIGLGYMHAFHPRDTYAQNDNGSYEKINDWGKPSAMASFSLGVGYDTGKRLSPFLRYQWLVQAPYAGEDLPFVPQALLHAGVKIKLKRIK